jgi:hypothetical protein
VCVCVCIFFFFEKGIRPDRVWRQVHSLQLFGMRIFKPFSLRTHDPTPFRRLYIYVYINIHACIVRVLCVYIYRIRIILPLYVRLVFTDCDAVTANLIHLTKISTCWLSRPTDLAVQVFSHVHFGVSFVYILYFNRDIVYRKWISQWNYFQKSIRVAAVVFERWLAEK